VTEYEDLVGQRLVIGFPGKKITPEIIRHFKALRAGGLIFYRINFDSPKQIKKVITDLEDALERKLLVTLDHEGGRVTMFGEGVTIFPDNQALGVTGRIDYAKKQGQIEAKELRRMGIDVNLSPVLDVLTDSFSPNIGIRSYGKDWKLVSEMGAARISAMQKGGVSACAKHFPGKGHAPVDAHLSLPVITSTWKEMEEIHLKPFIRAIETGVDLIMSSHPYYPKLDPSPDMIATFSRKIIYDTLRNRLGFKGVISSDDLEMGAVKATCPIGEAAVRATHAGHDLLLVCHDLNLQKEVFGALVDAYKNKTLSISELEKSVRRIERVRAKRKKRFEGGPPHAEPGGLRLAKIISEESVTILKNHIPARAGRLAGKKLTVIFPKLSAMAQKIMIEKVLTREKQFIDRAFAPFKLKPKFQLVSMDPTAGEIAQSKELARRSDLTVFFCWDAHLSSQTRLLLENLQNTGGKLAVVLLRDPYDVEFIESGVSAVTDFGWRACQISASINKLFK